MVVGTLVLIGVTFIAGYVTRYYQANADQDDQRRNRVDRLKRRLKELDNERSSSCCWYFFTFFLISTFLVVLGIFLNVINFFGSKKLLPTAILDWGSYWLNYDDYPGIVGVAVTLMIVVVIIMLFILCKLCWDIKKQENEHNEIHEELHHQHNHHGGRGIFAQGWMTINNIVAIERVMISCFNIHCTCYITLVASSTALAFMSVVLFCCYVLYTYLSK